MGKSESIIASYRSEVEAHLTSHMETLHGPIYDPARYLLEVGGKRIRPCLLLAAVEAFGGSRATAMNEAIAIEIFHNFTLLHDDVMDDADTRRGRPVVHIKWNESQAILTGDIMFAISYDLLMDKKNEAISMDILRLFNRTASEVCIGQQMDMDFEQRDDVRVNEYLEMIRLKTSVLLGASMGMGAMLAGADSKNVHAIYDYALNVGMAFQMQDDYLDAFGDMDKVGKRVGGDIIRNKKTILLLNALNMAQSDDKKRLQNWLSTSDKDDEKVAAVKEIMISCGAVEDLERRKKEYMDTALKQLDQMSLSLEWKEGLRSFAKEQLSRTY